MRTFFLLGLTAVVFLSGQPEAAAQNQNWGRVEGIVTEAEAGRPVPYGTVVVYGTNYGTAADAAGFYGLPLPVGRYVLRFSAVGFGTRLDTVAVGKAQTLRLDVALPVQAVGLDGITVEENRAVIPDAGVFSIDPALIENIPAPMQDGFRVLKTMPGVASNNETSSEYSVRGGGYNENLVIINGYEVHKSFRLRKGEQEGQGIINPAMADQMTLYTGGFPARYGGKLSSALEVDYRRPAAGGLHGMAVASLLEMGVTVGGATRDGRLAGLLGARRARTHHFFDTQELKGGYEPDFHDVQGLLSYRLSPAHALELVGLWMQHRFRFTPRAKDSFYGSVYDLRRITSAYEGDEVDRYATRFAGLRLKSQLGPRLRAEHDVAVYDTDEDENSAIKGVNVFFKIIREPETGRIDTTFADGAFAQQESFFNHVQVRMLTGQGRWLYYTERHAAEVGWHVRGLSFADRLHEASFMEAIPDSLGERWLRNLNALRQIDPDSVVVVDYRGTAQLDAMQAGFYLQDAVDLLPTRNRMVLTAGLRGDYFSFNRELTLSPRLTVRYEQAPGLVWVAAAGVYHQAPTYRELRGDPDPGQPLPDALNRDLRAQRSLQFSGGLEYFRPRSRLYFRAEAYYKHLSRLITYDVQNVRVSYSGENDARGYAYGLDLRIHGEFLPGLESWVNYSYLRSRERFLAPYVTAATNGLIPRPMDQAHTASLVIQDYLPEHPTWLMNLRLLYGSGFPYTPPRPTPGPNGTTIQVPAQRNAFRFRPYLRIDLGFSKIINFERTDDAEEPVRLQLTAALLNMFDNVSAIRYGWAPDAEGLWQRIPTRLTPRTFNLRARVDF